MKYPFEDFQPMSTPREVLERFPRRARRRKLRLGLGAGLIIIVLAGGLYQLLPHPEPANRYRMARHEQPAGAEAVQPAISADSALPVVKTVWSGEREVSPVILRLNDRSAIILIPRHRR
jgi:hypothetical protein